ncbi:MAG: NAD(P)H-dependent oxidoreductase [Pacificimonas sp.]
MPPSATSRLLIVWHSHTGGTRQMAEAAAAGARFEAGTETVVLSASDAGPSALLAADGYLFAAPENLAAIAGVMKSFYDRCYYPVLGRIEGRPYAQMVCAGSDGENCARQTARIAKGWRLKMVAEPLIVRTHAQTPDDILAEKTIDADDLTRCRELGQSLAAGLAMGVF